MKSTKQFTFENCNKMHTASLLRCRELLQEKQKNQKNANNYTAAKGQQI